jgi:hypothetical protein
MLISQFADAALFSMAGQTSQQGYDLALRQFIWPRGLGISRISSTTDVPKLRVWHAGSGPAAATQ